MQKIDNEITNEIVVYKTGDGDVSFNVNVFEETVWLTQKQMADLFNVSVPTINEHINNIFKVKELEKSSTIRNFRIVQREGARNVKRYVDHFNLDVIISTGYRVNSERATQFRKWATKILKQYMLGGYAINETRIKEIKSSIDELVSSQKILKEDVSRIENLLFKLVEKPIVIHNHNNNQFNFGGDDLEKKVIELLDRIIVDLEENQLLKKQLQEIKEDIANYKNNPKSKKRVINFINEVGDSNSRTHKIIVTSGIAKNIITELVKLCIKLKDLF